MKYLMVSVKELFLFTCLQAVSPEVWWILLEVVGIQGVAPVDGKAGGT